MRFDGIDTLRGGSILAVVLLHITIRMRVAGVAAGAGLPPWLSHLLLWNGDNGVTVFFAVSGFLITTTSLRRFGSLTGMRPARFYRLRFARIAPLLLALLAVLGFLHLTHATGFVIQPTRATLPRALFAALTFHLNWLEAVHGYLPPNWDVLWSLSVEEMFYFCFPLACLLLLRRHHGLPVFSGVLLAFVLMGPFARTIWAFNDIWKDKTYLGGMDAIAMGCLSALLVDRLSKRPPVRGLRSIEIVGVAMILLIAVWPGWSLMRFFGRTGLDGTVLALGTCLVMIGSVLRGATSGSWTAPVRWLGRHSYEVYLTHEFAVVWGTQLYLRLRGGLAPWYAGILLVSAALGAVVARYYSEPMNERLRVIAKDSPTERFHGEPLTETGRSASRR